MKKLISLALVLILSLSFAVTAFAEDSTKLVVLGDSIAYGTGLKDNDTLSYGALIAQANGYTYENFARNGDTTYDLNEKLMKNEIITAVDSADIIAVSIGGNNFLSGGIPVMIIGGFIGNYNRIDSIADNFYDNFSIAVDKIREINSEAELLVQTLYNPQTGILKQTYQYGVDKLNGYIKQLAEEKDFTVVEVAAAFIGHADEYIQDDIIHPNEKGHYVIACEYLKVLKDMGLGTADKPLIDEAEVVVYSIWDKIIDFFKSFFKF